MKVGSGETFVLAAMLHSDRLKEILQHTVID